jgi:hypothetical protein
VSVSPFQLSDAINNGAVGKTESALLSSNNNRFQRQRIPRQNTLMAATPRFAAVIAI